MSFECYNEYPTYENSTDVKLIKFTDEYGKQNFVYKSQCDMIMSIFPKAQSNTVTSDSIDYLIKYKTVIKEEDIKNIIRVDLLQQLIEKFSMLNLKNFLIIQMKSL